MTRKIIFLAICVQLGACATPESVRDLAKKTSANVALAGKEVKSMEARRKELAEQRAQSAGRLIASTQRLQGSVAADLAIADLVNDKATKQQYEKLKSVQQTMAGIRADHSAGADEFAAQILLPRQKLEVDGKALDEVAKILVKLGEKKSLLARAKFLVAFVKDVSADIKKLQDEAEKQVEDSKADIQKVESRVDADTDTAAND
ncbi:MULTISPECIES: hypothetical protein [Kordiimonas]|jgi:hypothetical protein|uniref:hypothetical protein n=1 Tax=Kordiimonas TaxID=288021 RepID=UPI00257F8759|nr:hypothetical protein [Kordiimonas sp. UBA4487]